MFLDGAGFARDQKTFDRRAGGGAMFENHFLQSRPHLHGGFWREHGADDFRLIVLDDRAIIRDEGFHDPRFAKLAVAGDG